MPQQSTTPPIERHCEHCGESFHTWAYKLRKGEGRFCSARCRYAERRPLAERFWEKVDKDGPVPAHRAYLGRCWVWLAALVNGYGVIGSGGSSESGERRLKAHRVSWELHFGAISDGLWVLHKCDNPRCVRPDHLFLGTHGENMQDCVDKGRHQPYTKLTETQVRQVRNLLTSGRTYLEIAEGFGVSESAIGMIARGETWTRVI